MCQGVAQLVARAVRDCEVVGSNPITLTTKKNLPEGAFFGFLVEAAKGETNVTVVYV